MLDATFGKSRCLVGLRRKSPTAHVRPLASRLDADEPRFESSSSEVSVHVIQIESDGPPYLQVRQLDPETEPNQNPPVGGGQGHTCAELPPQDLGLLPEVLILHRLTLIEEAPNPGNQRDCGVRRHPDIVPASE